MISTIAGPCPYDGAKVRLGYLVEVYGERARLFGDGHVWMCSNYPKCDAYVGCHRGTTIPLGRIANRELRRAKMAAHAAFDPIWRDYSRRNRVPKRRARLNAYLWLAEELRMPAEKCHIGEFDVAECLKVVEICGAVKK